MEGDEPSSLGNKPVDEIEMLDLKGDLILAVGRRRHLVVSSKVLTLSCPFFQTMLQSNAFVEGVDQPNVNHPPVKEIREDHPDTFSLICRVLHYLPVDPPDSIDDYRHLADLCDFYGCAKALSFHVRAWMDKWTLTFLDAPQLQTLMWVAFVFGLHNLFSDISFQLALAMEPKEWDDWEVHPMPAHVKDDMRSVCEQVKRSIQLLIECNIDQLCANNERHAGRNEKICGQCFRNKPWATKKCGHCGSSNFHDYICTKEIRLSLFKDWLQSQGFWPLSKLNTVSCRKFLRGINEFIDSRTPCGFDDSCPLAESKKRLIAVLREAKETNVISVVDIGML